MDCKGLSKSTRMAAMNFMNKYEPLSEDQYAIFEAIVLINENYVDEDYPFSVKLQDLTISMVDRIVSIVKGQGYSCLEDDDIINDACEEVLCL